MQKEGIGKLTSRQIRRLEKLGWPKAVIKKTLQHPQDRQFIVKLECIGVELNNKKILKNINLAIKDKEIFGIIGLAGSGKSTLLNILVGLVQPTDGRVLMRLKETEKDIDLADKRNLSNSLMGFSTQNSSVYPDLTVEENIEYFASLYGFRADSLEEVKKSIFNLVSLKNLDKIKAKNLSKGLQKKLDIACSLVHTPDILVLDEPTADLDPLLCRELWALIRRINNAGTTIILTSHQSLELDNVCDRVGILHNGVLSKVVNVKGMTHEPYEIKMMLPHPKHFFKNIKEDATFKKNQVIVRSKNPLNTAQKLLRELKRKKGDKCLISFEIRKPSLEKIFNEVIET